MVNAMRIRTFAAAAVVTFLAGCAATVSQSGFLRDYSQLKPVAVVDGAMSAGDRGAIFRNYDRFIIDPVIVHFAPDAKGTAINPKEISELVEYFDSRARKAFADKNILAARPGPRVARIRVAMTDIKEAIPVLNIHPATKLSGLGLGGATMEAEVLDSLTNRRIFAILDTQKGTRI